jgi:hypothetical protein
MVHSARLAQRMIPPNELTVDRVIVTILSRTMVPVVMSVPLKLMDDVGFTPRKVCVPLVNEARLKLIELPTSHVMPLSNAVRVYVCARVPPQQHERERERKTNVRRCAVSAGE